MNKKLLIFLILLTVVFVEAKKQQFDFLKSEAARFAKIALTEDGQTILSLVFDESDGLGTGFDRLYILKNKKIKLFSKGKARKLSKEKETIKPSSDVRNKISSIQRKLKKQKKNPVGNNLFRINLDVLFNNKFKKTKIPVSLEIEVPSSKTKTVSQLNSQERKVFDLTAQISFQNKKNHKYIFSGKLKTSDTFEDAPVTYFNGNIDAEANFNIRKTGMIFTRVSMETGGLSVEYSPYLGPIDYVRLIPVPWNKDSYSENRKISNGMCKLKFDVKKVINKRYILQAELNLGPLYDKVILSKEIMLNKKMFRKGISYSVNEQVKLKSK